jgi:hypothetical protein
MPEYDFDGAAAPNSDHLFTTNFTEIKATIGTMILWFSPDTFTTDQALVWSGVNGATDDEFYLVFEGTVANDPLSIVLMDAGVVTYQGRFAASLINSQQNCVAIYSDGTALRAQVNGQISAITDIVGANAGQWFASATSSNRLAVGAAMRAALALPYDGKMQKLYFDAAAMTTGEIAKAARLGYQRFLARL